MNEEYDKLIKEDVSLRKDCDFCKESILGVGQKSGYGVIIYKIGSSIKDGWFATLSPRTGGNPEEDFTIQLMPFAHLTHFSQVNAYPELAKNYGIAFSRISSAITYVMAQNKDMKAIADSRETGMPLAIYGKCTTWEEKKEHLHLKMFPFRGAIGQPSTVDSSFGRKEIHRDVKTGEEFVKMNPVRKENLTNERFNELSNLLISLLK